MEISERGGLKRREREIQTVNLTQESGGWGTGGQTLRMKTGVADLTSEDVFVSKVPTLFLSLVFFHKAKEEEKKKRICVTSIARVAVEKNQKKMFFQLCENAAKC